MRNSIKAVCAVGSAALIISSSAMAQIEVPTLGVDFGQLTLTMDDDGVGGCAEAVNNAGHTGAKCNTLATGSGFIQRQIDVGGLTYIQTVINDGEGFESEDFIQIKFGNTGAGINGVASRLTLTDGDVVGTTTKEVNTAAGKAGFVAESTVFSGWAHTTGLAGDSAAVIRVDVGDNTDSNNEFLALFEVDTEFVDATGLNTINSMKADQTVMLGKTTDLQRFYTEIKAASTTVANTSPYEMTANAVGDVSFNAGEMIQFVWVGQTIDNLGTFGASSLANIEETPSTPTSALTTVNSLSDTGPFDWTSGGVLETEFTTAPTF